MPLSQLTKLEVSLRVAVYQEHYYFGGFRARTHDQRIDHPSVEEMGVCLGQVSKLNCGVKFNPPFSVETTESRPDDLASIIQRGRNAHLAYS